MRIYVGNLPFGVDDGSLSTLFDEYGEVDSAKVVVDRITGRSRGFGFVEMSDGKEARHAIEAINGHEIEGRALTVNEAKPRAKQGGQSGRRGGGRRGW